MKIVKWFSFRKHKRWYSYFKFGIGAGYNTSSQWTVPISKHWKELAINIDFLMWEYSIGLFRTEWEEINNTPPYFQ